MLLSGTPVKFAAVTPRKRVGLRNTRDGMVRETPQNGVSEQKIGPCEQRKLLASAGCGTINPANLGASSFAICQRQQLLSPCAERVGRGRKVGLLLCGEASVESGRHRGGAGPLREPELLE
jgi:hypothetical protein